MAGSDHLPVLLELCAAGIEAAKIGPPKLEAEAREQVRETINEAPRRA